jgi:hypothetical protein
MLHVVVAKKGHSPVGSTIAASCALQKGKACRQRNLQYSQCQLFPKAPFVPLGGPRDGIPARTFQIF